MSESGLFASSKQNLRKTKTKEQTRQEKKLQREEKRRRKKEEENIVKEDIFDEEGGAPFLTQQEESPQSAGAVGCSGYYQASIFIAADSDFVNDAYSQRTTVCIDPVDCGSGTPADVAAAAIQDVFAAVQKLYKEQVCVDLTLKGMDIRTVNTSAKPDPYKNMVSGDVCGNLLPNLSTWLMTGSNDPSGGDRTLFHLFYGRRISGGIGCAWIGETCDTRYGVGVNEMTYQSYSQLVYKRNLMAHEMGHNFNGECFSQNFACLESLYVLTFFSIISSARQRGYGLNYRYCNRIFGFFHNHYQGLFERDGMHCYLHALYRG